MTAQDAWTRESMLEADLELARQKANEEADRAYWAEVRADVAAKRANAAEAQLQHAILDLEACEAAADRALSRVAAADRLADRAERERQRGHQWSMSTWVAALRVALR